MMPDLYKITHQVALSVCVRLFVHARVHVCVSVPRWRHVPQQQFSAGGAELQRACMYSVSLADWTLGPLY
jgi:hypothetical protein